MTPTQVKGRRFRCQQQGCTNHYDEIVGGDGWGVKPGQGGRYGDCLPCWVAATVRYSPGGTLETVAANPQMRALIESVLVRGGWTWEDVERSYHRVPPPKLR